MEGATPRTSGSATVSAFVDASPSAAAAAAAPAGPPPPAAAAGPSVTGGATPGGAVTGARTSLSSAFATVTAAAAASTGHRSVVLEGTIHKGTTSSELVVVRKVVLLQGGKFITYHDFDRDPGNQKVWYLDGRCELSPKAVADVCQPQRKTVRPMQTWTITAKVKGKGEPVSLYMFTVVWPKRWAPKGYTTFTLGCTTLEEARLWYTHFAVAIDGMKISMLEGKKSMKDRDRRDSLMASLPKGFSLPPSLPSSLITSADYDYFPTSAHPAAVGGSAEMGIGARVTACKSEPAGTQRAVDWTDEAGIDSPSELLDTDIKQASTSVPKRSLISERWVPLKQTNGVAIYHHCNNEDDSGTGGEYMVSATVGGPPGDVLDVLMSNSANTTILGPATKVEVLGCEKDKGVSKEILRIVMEAPGWAGWLCAPREMIVERMQKPADDGVYVVLFSSVGEHRAHTCSFAKPKAACGATESCVVQQVAKAKVNRQHSLYTVPVAAHVNGGYTISPLHGYGLDSSPESLITCIIKVDLGGICSDLCFGKPVADLFGWTDAFLDRILMSVTLIRDEVEHSRYLAHPFVMMASSGPPGATSYSEALSHSASNLTDVGEGLASPGEASVNSLQASMSYGKSRGASMGRLSTQMGKKVCRKTRSALDSMLVPLAESSPVHVDTASCVFTSEGVSPLCAVPLDLDRIQALATLAPHVWEELHIPGKAAPFRVRGPTYLKDRKKIPAGETMFAFGSMDVIEVPHVVEHVARFLPAVRDSGMPFGIIINLIIPGTPLLGIVATFITETHPDILGEPPQNPMFEDHDWTPFDFVLHKFVKGNAATRNMMLKLIPHIADGSWMIRQSVGTTPVILGKALKTIYTVTPQYIEIDIDISANQVASYVTGLVRGATKSLVIDMGFVLEGTAPWELPEVLLGTLRLNHLDLKYAHKLDITHELPLRPPMPSHQPQRASGAGAPAVSPLMHRRSSSLSGDAAHAPRGVLRGSSVPAPPRSASFKDTDSAAVFSPPMRPAPHKRSVSVHQ